MLRRHLSLKDRYGKWQMEIKKKKKNQSNGMWEKWKVKNVLNEQKKKKTTNQKLSCFKQQKNNEKNSKKIKIMVFLTTNFFVVLKKLCRKKQQKKKKYGVKTSSSWAPHQMGLKKKA